MPNARGSTASRLFRPTRRTVALSCFALAAATAASSFALGSPLERAWPVTNEFDWIPLVGGGLPIIAMLMSVAGLFGGRDPAPIAIDSATARQLEAGMRELKTVARLFDEALSGQRAFADLLTRTCETAARDTSGASARIADVTETAIAAQCSLAAGIVRWEQASDELRARLEACAPVSGDAAPRETAAANLVADLGAAANQLGARIDAAVATLVESTGDAAEKIAELTEVSQALRRDASALDSAGWKIAASGDAFVAKASATISDLPGAVASLRTTAEAAVQTVTEAAAMLCGDSAALDAAARETADAVTALRREAEAMRAAGAIVTAADRDAVAGLVGDIDAAVGRLATAAGRTDTLSQDLAQLPQVSGRMEAVAATLVDTARGLEAGGQRIAAAGESAIERMAETASRNEMAMRVLPALASDFGLALDTLGATVGALCKTHAGIGQIDVDGLRMLGETLETMAASLPDAVETRLMAAMPTALGEATHRLEAAASRLDQLELVTDLLGNLARRLPAEATDWLRQAIPAGLPRAAMQLETVIPKLDHLEMVSSRLEAVAEGLVQAGSAIPADTGTRLEAALPRLDQLAMLSLRLEQLVARMPADMAGGLERLVTAIVPAATDRLAAAQPRLDRLDAISQRLEDLAAQLPSDLAQCLIESIPAGLPDTAARLDAVPPKLAQLDQVSRRLEAVASHLPSDVAARIPAGLPETTARLDAAGVRFESLLDRMPPEAVQTAAVANLAAVAGAISDSLRRVETALDGQDRVLEAMVAAADEVRSAARTAEAARPAAACDAGALPGAALIQADQIITQSQQLLWRTEALAEAVMAGRTPDLSGTLADRTPSLLAGLEAAAQRLRWTATALAIANDGPGGARHAGAPAR